jgi:hypothetical protein
VTIRRKSTDMTTAATRRDRNCALRTRSCVSTASGVGFNCRLRPEPQAAGARSGWLYVYPRSWDRLNCAEFSDTQRNSRAPRIACSRLASLPAGFVAGPWQRIRGRGSEGRGPMFVTSCAVCECSLTRICPPAVSCGSSRPSSPANFRARPKLRLRACPKLRIPNCAPSVQSIQRATHRVAPTWPGGSVQDRVHHRRFRVV